MHCPTCEIEFGHYLDLAHGLHVDYKCSCGQLLQWDYPCQSLRDAAFSIGPSKPCKHTELRNPQALFPHSAPSREGVV